MPMKTTIRIFAVLDIISILLLLPQLYQMIANRAQISFGTLSILKIVFTLLTFVLLFISASGLIRITRAVFVSYYIQFPMRLVVWIFSFGFLTFISQYFSSTSVFEWMFRLVFVLEFFRLFFTIQIHKKYFSGGLPTVS